MLSLAHTLISLPFAVYLDNPLLIFVAAFVFHLFADTLLHWNIYPDDFKKYPFVLVGIDVASGLIVSYLLLGNEVFTIPVIAAIAGGNAPDMMHAFWEFIPSKTRQARLAILKPFFVWHDKLQLETKNMWLGLISQAILVAVAAYLIR